MTLSTGWTPDLALRTSPQSITSKHHLKAAPSDFKSGCNSGRNSGCALRAPLPGSPTRDDEVTQVRRLGRQRRPGTVESQDGKAGRGETQRQAVHDIGGP